MKKLTQLMTVVAAWGLAVGCMAGEAASPNFYNTKAALIARPATVVLALADSATPQEYSTKRALLSRPAARRAACPACGTWRFAPASYNTKLALRDERSPAFERVPASWTAKCACAECGGCSPEGCARM